MNDWAGLFKYIVLFGFILIIGWWMNEQFGATFTMLVIILVLGAGMYAWGNSEGGKQVERGAAVASRVIHDAARSLTEVSKGINYEKKAQTEWSIQEARTKGYFERAQQNLIAEQEKKRLAIRHKQEAEEIRRQLEAHRSAQRDQERQSEYNQIGISRNAPSPSDVWLDE